MYRCCLVRKVVFPCAVKNITRLKRGSLVRAPFRRIYRGGISVFTTPQSAEVFVVSLHEEERVLLREALRIHDQEDGNIGKMA